MLDEEKLSGKLAILEKWMGAVACGHQDMTPRGAKTFLAILEQCQSEAAGLEAAMRRPALTLVARGELVLAAGQIDAAAGLALVAGDRS